MCTADSFQQKSGNLCLTVKFTLSNSYFLFRLKVGMHIRCLYNALRYTFWLQQFQFIQSYSYKCINQKLRCLKYVLFLCRSLVGKKSNCILGSEMLRPCTPNSFIIRHLPHRVNVCRRQAFFCQQYNPTSPNNNQEFIGITVSAPWVLPA